MRFLFVAKTLCMAVLLSGVMLPSGSAFADDKPGPTAHLVVKPDGRLLLNQELVSAPKSKSFAFQPFFAKGAVRLKDRLQELRPQKVTIRFPQKCNHWPKKTNRAATMKGPRWTSHDLVNILAEVRAAGVGAWELRLGRRRCGAVIVLGEKAHARIDASDVALQERVENGVLRTSTDSLTRRTQERPRAIRLAVDFGMPLPELCTILSKVDGDRVCLGIHTGPF